MALSILSPGGTIFLGGHTDDDDAFRSTSEDHHGRGICSQSLALSGESGSVAAGHWDKAGCGTAGVTAGRKTALEPHWPELDRASHRDQLRAAGTFALPGTNQNRSAYGHRAIGAAGDRDSGGPATAEDPGENSTADAQTGG